MNNIERKDKKKLLFYICGISLPVLQFVIFYVFVNFNSIILAFQNWNIVDGYTFSLSNFTDVFHDIFVGSEEFSLKFAFINSFKYYVVSLIFCTGLGVLFSNYIYKKNFGSRFFQIILFLPKILSSVVIKTLFSSSLVISITPLKAFILANCGIEIFF